MKVALLSIFALASVVIAQRNPNPCADVTGTDTFRNDWASCADYFWCLNDQAIIAGPCPQGQGFDEDQNQCTYDMSTCDSCPQTTGESPLAVSCYLIKI